MRDLKVPELLEEAAVDLFHHRRHLWDMARLLVSGAELAKKIRAEAGYFGTNAARMNYPEFGKTKSVHRFGRYRSGLQNCRRPPAQTVRHVPDRQGSTPWPYGPQNARKMPVTEP